MNPVRGIILNGRAIMRHLDRWEPHFWREDGMWCCASAYGPTGAGATPELAQAAWKIARLKWARDIPNPPSKAGSRAVMALGHLPTENLHVQSPRTVPVAS